MKIKEFYESPQLELFAMLSADSIAQISLVDPEPDVDPEMPDVEVE